MPLRQHPELTELMDRPDVDPKLLAANLRDLRWLNALLGWRRSCVRTVASLTEAEGLRAVRLLDVATGSADIPLAIANWAQRHGIALEGVVSDAHPRTVHTAERAARRAGLTVVRHDALHCPFPTRSFDIVMCNLALHHFPPESAVMLLRELGRVGRYVVVTDLIRSRSAYIAAIAAGQMFGQTLTAHDGPISVLRAYTVPEVKRLATAAGLDVTVRAVFPFRLIAVGRRAEGVT
jgi:2-polyprenyl-3-methyl-5-hydroxy-6-metoxy-1,4-benzoquinol methylase